MKKVHFIGIGGMGMSALARLLLDRGVGVAGSDSEEGSAVRKLRRLGGDVAIGHRAENLHRPDCVVYSSAVSPANPELIAARNQGIPVFHRGQMLARLVEGRRTLAVAGSHGKSTTAAMIAQIAVQAGLDPLAILGAEVDSLGGNLRPGKGIYAVVEADESDNSFLWLRPWGAVVTNVDEEHLDFFRNDWEISEAYRTFVSRVDPKGFLVFCADDVPDRRLFQGVGWTRWSYGFSKRAEFRAERVEADAAGSRYLCTRAGRRLGPVRLRVPGRHNLLNSLAAIAAAQGVGVGFLKAAQALEAYRGAHRRFQIHGEHRGVTVVEDYGHHPAEIQATLQAARAGRAGRVRCLFQPHRYSRTRHLMGRFADCFSSADELILLPVYAASEDPLEGATSEALARGIRTPCRSRVRLQAPEEALAYLKKTAASGDLILFLGAGSVGQLAGKFLKRLTKKA